jgi:hypothetical protein
VLPQAACSGPTEGLRAIISLGSSLETRHGGIRTQLQFRGYHIGATIYGCPRTFRSGCTGDRPIGGGNIRRLCRRHLLGRMRRYPDLIFGSLSRVRAGTFGEIGPVADPIFEKDAEMIRLGTEYYRFSGSQPK